MLTFLFYLRIACLAGSLVGLGYVLISLIGMAVRDLHRKRHERDRSIDANRHGVSSGFVSRDIRIIKPGVTRSTSPVHSPSD